MCLAHSKAEAHIAEIYIAYSFSLKKKKKKGKGYPEPYPCCHGDLPGLSNVGCYGNQALVPRRGHIHQAEETCSREGEPEVNAQ